MFKEFVGLYNRLAAMTKRQRTGMSVEDTYASGTGWANIYGKSRKSLLFEGVLTESEEKNSTSRPATLIDRQGEAFRNSNLSEKIRIGEKLKKNTDSVTAAARQLLRLSDETTRLYLSYILSLLENQIYDIAFLGQMNAGKSSLINVFIDQPELLPTDINPWTTVITNIYFGAPNHPKGGALFEFFERDEWQRLAEGGGRVRELTRRLIPDFDWSGFSNQIGNMRTRAERKLGPRFDQLLGERHWFSQVTPDLLEKYVCAGDEMPDSERRAAGEYSDITKVANVYFDLGAFCYPTVIIDTPGVNDPFLVRDEITRQNLERAGIFVVVVTARQPLSHADLDLLRLLRGLSKEKIIIFVNKVDEVTDLDESLPQIESRIRALLHRELPGSKIPVIFGSARWAKAALTCDKDEIESQMGPADDGYVDHIATISSSFDALWGESAGNSEATAKLELMADTLLMRSGLPALALEISEFMQNGPVSDRVNKVAGACSVTARNMEAGLRHTLSVLDAMRLDRETPGCGTVKAAAAKLDLLDATKTAAENAVASCAAGLERIKQENIAALNDNFQKLLAAFVETETARFAAHLSSNTLEEWRCLTMQLRLQFEKELVQNFSRAFAQSSEAREKLEAEFVSLAKRAASEADLPLEAGSPLVFKNYPAVTALSDRVTFDDSNQLLAEWWRRSLSAESRIQEFKNILTADFTAVAGKLARAMDAELGAISDSIQRYYRVLINNIAMSHQRGLELISRHELMISHSDHSGGDAYGREIEMRTLEAQARLTSVTGITSGFLQQDN